MDERDLTIARLRAELAAARRTIEVLSDRVEAPGISETADRFALHRTIGNLQQAVRRTMREHEVAAAHYRALFDQSPDAIIATDGTGQILDCNQTASTLFGRSREELTGTALAVLFESSCGAALTGLLWSGFAGEGDSHLRLPDGRYIGFSVARLAGGAVLTSGHLATPRKRVPYLQKPFTRGQLVGAIRELVRSGAPRGEL